MHRRRSVIWLNIAGELPAQPVAAVLARQSGADCSTTGPFCTRPGLHYRRCALPSRSDLVVCEAEKFAGIVTIEALLSAAAESRVDSLMDLEPPTVKPGVDQEIAAWRAVEKGASALSVVDENGRFLGLIPPHRLLAVLLSEHEEDLARIGSFLKGSSVARAASTEPVRRRLAHRLPWLLVGLGGAMLAADMMHSRIMPAE